MADTKAGNTTSEYALTKWVMVAGMVLTVIAAVLQELQNQGMNFGWLPVALAIVGPLMALVKAMGYTASRTHVKTAELAAKGAMEVAHLIPLVQEAVRLSKEKEAASSVIPPAGT